MASTGVRYRSDGTLPTTIFPAPFPKRRVWERKHRGEAVLRGEGLVEDRSAAPATRHAIALLPERCAFGKPHFRAGSRNSVSSPWPASSAARRCARFDEDGNQDQLASHQGWSAFGAGVDALDRGEALSPWVVYRSGPCVDSHWRDAPAMARTSACVITLPVPQHARPRISRRGLPARP